MPYPLGHGGDIPQAFGPLTKTVTYLYVCIRIPTSNIKWSLLSVYVCVYQGVETETGCHLHSK